MPSKPCSTCSERTAQAGRDGLCCRCWNTANGRQTRRRTRPFAERPRPKPHQVCSRCHLRWRQTCGLCVSCGREEGIAVLNGQARDAERLARQRARSETCQRVDETPQPTRFVEVDGMEYEVVWP